jgi:HSP20 family protein
LRGEGDELLIDERPQGEFSRQLFLGDNLDTARLSARVERGVLTLEIPVAESSKPRKVEIGSTERKPQTIETGGQQPASANA